MTPAELRQLRQLEKLKKRGQSDLIEVRDSVIHGTGVYAACDIGAEEHVVEYVGNLIDKETSEKRAWEQYDVATETGGAAVYIFNLTEKWDLDGNVEWNPARLINHSCAPNCEAVQDGKRIFIQTLGEPVKKGEELTFDYGFEAESYADHPCRCGAESCIGYIVGKDYYDEFKKLLAAET